MRDRRRIDTEVSLGRHGMGHLLHCYIVCIRTEYDDHHSWIRLGRVESFWQAYIKKCYCNVTYNWHPQENLSKILTDKCIRSIVIDRLTIIVSVSMFEA